MVLKVFTLEKRAPTTYRIISTATRLKCSIELRRNEDAFEIMSVVSKPAFWKFSE